MELVCSGAGGPSPQLIASGRRKPVQDVSAPLGASEHARGGALHTCLFGWMGVNLVPHRAEGYGV